MGRRWQQKDSPEQPSADTTHTYVRLGSGDPRLQQERKTRLVEPPGGLHSDVDVLELQFRLCDMCCGPFSGPVSPDPPAAAVGSRVPRVPLGRGWSLLDGAVKRAGRRMVSHAQFGKAARA
ncbi:hypothetical protein VZT92_003317 [Zoarces viviparus]|uniref:Uncharacterized protein n=1 Tax=Zoarces viviparus TaxID=48416 RepID=A0AAW1G241_ZOAVI